MDFSQTWWIFFSRAMSGRICMFKNGKMKFNPTHGEDLEKVCVGNVLAGIKEKTVGGIYIWTRNELAELAL